MRATSHKVVGKALSECEIGTEIYKENNEENRDPEKAHI